MNREIKRDTHIIDAEGRILGRLANEIARLLRGKDKPSFSPEKDVGDFVVVKNPEKVKLTGKKRQTKTYYCHSGYLGGLKAISFQKLLKKDPRQIIKKAVWGMMPKTRLGRKQIKRLRFQ